MFKIIVYCFLSAFLFESCKSSKKTSSGKNPKTELPQKDNKPGNKTSSGKNPKTSGTKMNQSLVHLYSYMNAIKNNPKRIESFWNAGGWASKNRFEQGETFYFSTHGHGINYLHLRVETKASYYGGEATKIIDLDESIAFYNAHFKSQVTKKIIGEFSYAIDRSNTSYEVIRFLKGSKVLTRGEFVAFLNDKSKTGQTFRNALTDSITELKISGNGIQLKSPPISKNSKDQPYYYLSIPSSWNGAHATNYKDYSYHCKASIQGASKSTNGYQSNYLRTFGYENKKFEEIEKENKELSDGAFIFYGGSSGKPRTDKYMISPCPFN